MVLFGKERGPLLAIVLGVMALVFFASPVLPSSPVELAQAREQGKVRFIGFGGHKSPHIHLRLLKRGFAWDAVRCRSTPWTPPSVRSRRRCLPETIHRGAAVIGIKPVAGGALQGVKGVKPEESLRYCMSLPVSSVIYGMDSTAVLRKNLKLTTGFSAFHPGEMDALRQKARSTAGDGRAERYKTTQEHDLLSGQVAHGSVPPPKKNLAIAAAVAGCSIKSVSRLQFLQSSTNIRMKKMGYTFNRTAT